jgi:hypothetical protein
MRAVDVEGKRAENAQGESLPGSQTHNPYGFLFELAPLFITLRGHSNLRHDHFPLKRFD